MQSIAKLSIVFLVTVLTACGGGGGGGGGGGAPAPAPVNPCVLKTYNSQPLPEYAGAHSLPAPSNLKFDASVQRAIGLKDYYPGGENNGCASNKDYARLLYQKTLDRLQTLNIDVVEIYQYGPVDDFNATTWTADKSKWQIPESELIWFIKEANSRNIKVSLIWQLWGVDSKGNTIDTSMTTSEAYMLKVLRGWHNIIVEMAKLGGSNGLNMLTIEWNAFYFPVMTNYPVSATTEFVAIVDDIRQYFSGKLFMQASPIFFDSRLLNKVDAVIVPLNPANWTHVDDTNMSVGLLKSRYADDISGKAIALSIATGVNASSIPVIWDLNIQSRDRALSDGWVEDGFCITQVGGSPTTFSNPSCMQKNYVTDFSVQANAVEAVFQAIKEQTYVKTYGIIFSTSYWLTDTIVPSEEGFPNLSQSIRGKPAETIVTQWYKR